MNYKPNEYYPTIEEHYKISKIFDNSVYEIDILDTGDDEEYSEFLDIWLKFSRNIILVFSINDYESFEKIKRIHDKILLTKEKIIMILVGNKLDLENERVVSYSEAKELADSWRVRYFEVSSKNAECQKIFQIIIKDIIDYHSIIKPDPPCCPYCFPCNYLCLEICRYLCSCFL
jgi:small GTP-binding protein